MAFKSDLEALILAVLSERDLHGYEISKQIRQKSQEFLKVGEGQLYPALHKLEDANLISAQWIPQSGKPDRKVYKITPEGLKELGKHQNAWKSFASSISNILSASPEVSK